MILPGDSCLISTGVDHAENYVKEKFRFLNAGGSSKALNITKITSLSKCLFVCLTLEKILELLLNHCRKLLRGNVIFIDHTLRFSQIESLEPTCKVE